MEYLKVFTDFVEVIETLGEAERGRLFTAMLKYAGQGIEPDFRGNERFVWPIAKQNIDRTVEEDNQKTQVRREAGKKGAAKRWQAIANDGNAIFANGKDGDAKCAINAEKKGSSPFLPPSSLSPEPPISSTPYNPPSSQEKRRNAPKRFTPPSVEEVKAYCLERKNGLDAQAFVDFYSSKGWKVGNNPMKDWKAAVRTWENRRKGEAPKKETSYSMRDVEEDMKANLEKLMREYGGEM